MLYRPGTIKRCRGVQEALRDPVIAPDKPWEGMIGWTSVYRDPQTGKYQLWYQAYQERRKEDKSLKSVVCYAESDDGITWTKPNLGLFPFYEEKDTNIVLIGARRRLRRPLLQFASSWIRAIPIRRSATRWPTTTGARARRRRSGSRHACGVFAGRHSLDEICGRHRVEDALSAAKGMQPPFADEGPYVEETRKDGTRPQSTGAFPSRMSDALDVFYDPRHEAFVGYGKMWTPWPDGGLAWKHGMGRMREQGLHPLEQAGADPDRERSRSARSSSFTPRPCSSYNGMYFSLNQILDRAAGTMDIELMSSRDGFRWDRTFAGTFVIPRGRRGSSTPDRSSPTAHPSSRRRRCAFTTAAIAARPSAAVGLNGQVVGAKDYYSGVGLAITPRDRFVAVGVNPQSPVRGQKKDKPKIVNTIGNVTLKRARSHRREDDHAQCGCHPRARPGSKC